MKKVLNFVVSICLLLQMSTLAFHAIADSSSQKAVIFVDDDITVDTVWSGDYNYYICSTGNDEPKVLNGATLTIEEGAVVYFADGRNKSGIYEPVNGTDKYPYRTMSVESGHLIANGVKFTVLPGRYDGAWDGITLYATDAIPSSAVFNNCIFEYGGTTGAMVTTKERSMHAGGQTINLTVSECVFQNPVPGSTGVIYDNGYHRNGKGTVRIEKTTFTGFGRGVQIQRSDTAKEIDTYIDQCTFNNSTIRSVEIMDGRLASVTNCIFNNNNPIYNNIMLYYDYNDSNHPDEVVLSGNQFNGTASTFPMGVHAASKINKDADYTNSFGNDFPDEYKFTTVFGNVGRPAWANQNESGIWGNVGVPYILTNSVSINYCQDAPTSYSDLTIKPGVTVLLGNDAKLISRGKLIAEGTEDLPIQFKPAPGLDHAAYIEASRYGQVFLKHCIIEDFWMGLWIDYSRAENINDILVSVENCKISNTLTDAIHIFENSTPNGHIIIKNSEFGSASDGDNGIVIHQSKNVSISNCLIYGYKGNGVIFHLYRKYMLLYPEALKIENCTITKNDFSGVKLEIDPYFETLPENGVLINNSIITGNGVLNIAEDEFYQHERLSHPVRINYSLVGKDTVTFTNGIYTHQDNDYIQIPSGNFTNCIDSDPMFANADNFDFHLKSTGGRWNGAEWVKDTVTSPAIDSGNPESSYSLEPAPNGHRINMGYYGNTPFASKTFTISNYTVTYNANGGLGTAPTESEKQDGATFIAASASSFTAPTGKRFKEWNTKANGTGTAYSAGSQIVMPAQDIVLYAIWETATYSVTINSSLGGSISAGFSGNYVSGAIINITANPSDGYEFDGWVSSNGGIFGSIGSTSTTFVVPSNDTIVTAHFKANSNTDSGKYIPNSSIIIQNTSVTIDLTLGHTIVSAEQMEMLLDLNKEKPIVLNGTKYTLTFPKGALQIANESKDYDFGVRFDAGNSYNAIRKLSGEKFVLMLDFNHSGLLPGETQININVGMQYAGKTLQYYYYNPNTKELELIKSTITDENGYVTVSQSHCSSYVFQLSVDDTGVTDQDKSPDTGDNSNTLLRILLILASTITILIIFIHKRIAGRLEE